MTPTANATVDANLSHTVYALSNLADVHGPDTKDSPGARFLVRCQDEANDADADALLECVREFVAGGGDADDFSANDLSSDLMDNVSEWADSVVQIYTHQCWQEFADLCLWGEDLEDLGEISGSDLTRDVAMRAQYLVALRLIPVLLAERAQALLALNPVADTEDAGE